MAGRGVSSQGECFGTGLVLGNDVAEEGVVGTGGLCFLKIP